MVPNGSASFAVSEFDASYKLSSKISAFSLLAQTSTQQLYVPSSTSSTSSSALPTASIVAAVGKTVIVVVVVVVAVAALVFLRKCRSTLT